MPSAAVSYLVVLDTQLCAPLSLRMPAPRVLCVSLAVPQTSDTLDFFLSGPLEPTQKEQDERKEQTKVRGRETEKFAFSGLQY